MTDTDTRADERDTVTPDDDWTFNEDVARCFDDMLERSIPQYPVMRESVYRYGRAKLDRGGKLVDLGTSRGEAVARLIDERPESEFVLIETAPAMLDEVRKRFGHLDHVRILDHDLRHGLNVGTSDVIQSILTLQFIPINYRQSIVQRVYDELRQGGAFLLVEKILGATAEIDQLQRTFYHALKNEHGYTYEDIERKKDSLEGVLVPVTADWNVDLLRQAGFREIDCFWRWQNFAGWIAIK